MQNIRPKEDEMVDRLDELLVALGRRNSLRDPIAAAVEAMSLTPPQIHAILWLGREGQLTMGQIAQRVGVTDKTVTGLVDRLERDGFVERDRDGDDRRVVLARVTPKGRAIYGKLQRTIREKLGIFLSLLDEEDRQALFRILEKLLARVPAPGDAPHSTRR